MGSTYKIGSMAALRGIFPLSETAQANRKTEFYTNSHAKNNRDYRIFVLKVL